MYLSCASWIQLRGGSAFDSASGAKMAGSHDSTALFSSAPRTASSHIVHGTSCCVCTLLLTNLAPSETVQLSPTLSFPLIATIMMWITTDSAGTTKRRTSNRVWVAWSLGDVTGSRPEQCRHTHERSLFSPGSFPQHVLNNVDGPHHPHNMASESPHLTSVRAVVIL